MFVYPPIRSCDRWSFPTRQYMSRGNAGDPLWSGASRAATTATAAPSVLPHPHENARPTVVGSVVCGGTSAPAPLLLLPRRAWLIGPRGLLGPPAVERVTRCGARAIRPRWCDRSIRDKGEGCLRIHQVSEYHIRRDVPRESQIAR